MGCDSHGNLSEAEFSKPLPSIGIYVATASLICGLSMFADLLHGFRHRKYWFPCKYFSLNATTLTFISVCVKLSLDLNTSMPSRQDQLTKLSSSVFFCTVMANSMPSLGFMVTQDLLMNLMALGILVITDVVNICIQLGTEAIYVFPQEHALVIILMVLMFMILSFSAITVPATKRFLELKYKKKYEFAVKQCPSYTERRRGVPKLKEDLMKFWMMAHTSSPQFVMARSVTCITSGFLCFLSAVTLAEAMVRSYFLQPLGFCNGESDYKWSTTLVLVSQAAAVAIGMVAPASRWLIAVNLRCPSRAKKSLRDEMKVESYWVECLDEKKERPLNLWMNHSHRSRKLAHDINRLILDVCIATQFGIVLASKFLRFITVYFVSRILLCCLFFTFKSDSVANARSCSGSNPSTTRQFVLHLEGEEELVDYMVRSNREATEHLIQKGRKKQPVHLIELLETTTPISKGFEGIWDFDSDEVASLASGEPPNSWALPLVTLTSIAVALPNIEPYSLKKLVKAVNEALVYVKKFEDVLDIEGELGNSRKAAEVVWLGVDLYHKWLNVDLRKLSKQQKTTTLEVLRELVDIAKKEFTDSWQKNLILCMKHKPSRWPIKTLAANSMYRISQTLLNKYVSRNIGTEEILLKDVERMVSDIVAGCFCNAAQVIGMKCLVTAVEVREASVREAAMHLGRTEKVLEIVDRRCMPALSHHKVAKIDEWREFYRTNKCISPTHPSSQCTTSELILNVV